VSWKFFAYLQRLRQQYYADRVLSGNFYRRNKAPLEVDRELPSCAQSGRRVLLLVERDELHGRAFFLENLGAQIVRGIPQDVRPDDLAICFGYASLLKHAVDLHRSGVENIFFFEAGFLRSVLLDNSMSIYDQSICFFVDDMGFHFDSSVPTRIECILNDPLFKPGENELERARELRRKVVGACLTKYNDQPLFIALPPKCGERILVVEQARNDWAVLKSGGSYKAFEKMLQAALDENPSAQIFIKVHPDSLDGKRGGTRKSYYGRLKDVGRIKIIKEKVNPFLLLESIDKVYVFSSMLGFEAAMMGKEVHVFGRPCYAGWGATYDRESFPRRNTNRSLDEIFCGLYFHYQKYKNLVGDWCSAEDAVEILLRLRDQYFKEAGLTK
jgi:capsular polysaccharide export protein